MLPETHKSLFNIIRGAVFITFIIALYIWIRSAQSALIGLPCGTLVIGILLTMMLVYKVPVKCPQPGCYGQMRLEMTRFFSNTTQYKCTDCGAVYTLVSVDYRP
jgi:predicted RNA-binding Zn-ribbon protein involved in translation (DUF1610 family)